MSTVARDQAVAYLDLIGKNHELLSPEGTDAISFNNVGIPASGVLTGQDCCKSRRRSTCSAAKWATTRDLGTFDGGCVDNPFRWCDNLPNNDFDVMTFMSKTFANMVANMAFDKQIMSASGNYKAGGARGPNARGARGHPAA